MLNKEELQALKELTLFFKEVIYVKNPDYFYLIFNIKQFIKNEQLDGSISMYGYIQLLFMKELDSNRAVLALRKVYQSFTDVKEFEHLQKEVFYSLTDLVKVAEEHYRQIHFRSLFQKRMKVLIHKVNVKNES